MWFEVRTASKKGVQCNNTYRYIVFVVVVVGLGSALRINPSVTGLVHVVRTQVPLHIDELRSHLAHNSDQDSVFISL